VDIANKEQRHDRLTQHQGREIYKAFGRKGKEDGISATSYSILDGERVSGNGGGPAGI
jgi:hypothetical protein